jgi:YD repeat-containing protein
VTRPPSEICCTLFKFKYHTLPAKNPSGWKVEEPERAWQRNRSFGLPEGPSWHAGNPYVKTEYVSVGTAVGSAKMAAKDYVYDKNGNVVEAAEYDWVNYTASAGAGTEPVADQSNGYWHPAAPAKRDSAQRAAVSDGLGSAQAVTEWVYDNPLATGNVTQEKRWKALLPGTPPGSLDGATAAVVTRQYDAYGNVTVETDARGTQTQYIYGTVECPGYGTPVYAAHLYPAEVRVAAGYAEGQTRALAWDCAAGVVTAETDWNGVTTARNYDLLRRPIEVVEAGQRKTRIEYKDSELAVVTRRDLSVLGDGKRVAVEHYDALGRLRLRRETPESGAALTVANETAGNKVAWRYRAGHTDGGTRTPGRK